MVIYKDGWEQKLETFPLCLPHILSSLLVIVTRKRQAVTFESKCICLGFTCRWFIFIAIVSSFGKCPVVLLAILLKHWWYSWSHLCFSYWGITSFSTLGRNMVPLLSRVTLFIICVSVPPKRMLVTSVRLYIIHSLVWLCQTVCDVGLFAQLFRYWWR